MIDPKKASVFGGSIGCSVNAVPVTSTDSPIAMITNSPARSAMCPPRIGMPPMYELRKPGTQ